MNEPLLKIMLMVLAAFEWLGKSRKYSLECWFQDIHVSYMIQPLMRDLLCANDLQLQKHVWLQTLEVQRLVGLSCYFLCVHGVQDRLTCKAFLRSFCARQGWILPEQASAKGLS